MRLFALGLLVGVASSKSSSGSSSSSRSSSSHSSSGSDSSDTCELHGVYSDSGGTYNVSCKSATEVHIEGVAGSTPPWEPLDAAYDPASHTVNAHFSNAKLNVSGVSAPPQFNAIHWDNGATWQRQSPFPTRSVHLVYMTHLDLGFTDTTRNVCDKYFDSFFPAAFETAAELRKRGGKERFRWTEFPWLIQEYLDGGAGCAHRDRTPAELEAMENAIANDDVIWHKTAVNFLPEVLDRTSWAHSLTMCDDLNARFNKTWGLTGKHTDTPGMSRGAISTLLESGVKAYHIGYNAACAKNVATLPQAFRWRAVGGRPTGEDDLLTFVNDNYGSQIFVNENGRKQWENTPMSRRGMSAQTDHRGHENSSDGMGPTILVRHGIKGAEDVALIFQFTGDNGGLPTADAVVTFWSGLQAKFPNATIQASSLDDFTREVLSKADMAALPLIEGEIGDSWIYGAPADPIKVATFREATRALQEAISSGNLSEADSAVLRFRRRMMKGPAEHNWGLSIDHGSWSTDWTNELFEIRRAKDADWQKHEVEWTAQREWLHPCLANVTSASLPLTCNASNAAAAPGDDPDAWRSFVVNLERRLKPLTEPSLPDTSMLGNALTPASIGEMQPILCGDALVAFNEADGSIRDLVDHQTGRQWVGGGAGQMATFSYRTYSDADFSEVFAQEYTTSGDFMKTGMDSAEPIDAKWDAVLHRGFIATEDGGKACRVVMELAMADRATHVDYGSPLNISLEYNFPGSSGNLFDVALTWANKTSTRLAESSWLSFVPVSVDETTPSWSMDIMGTPISPLEVVPGGTHWLHAVSDVGVNFSVPSSTGSHQVAGSLRVAPLDTPLLSPGDTAHALRYNDEEPDAVHGGMHFNLHNNLWGTAFPQWYPYIQGEGGLLARFQVFAE
eukprot:INCI16292.10.p1 GENE.INCI16292.10~~INCI16292.10.p1  ORF type:complete len:901 (+),score=156.29 INCI16292.10:333-3035(+)